MILASSALSVKLWFDEACEIVEIFVPLVLAVFLFTLDLVDSPISCVTRNATVTQAAFIDQYCYSQLTTSLSKNAPPGDATYEVIAYGSVHHAYVAFFLLVFVILFKAPDVYYTRMCLPEFESIIAQFTIELRRVAANLEDDRDVAASTRTLRHVDSVLLLDTLANLQRSTRFFAAYALKHILVALFEVLAICLVIVQLSLHRGALFASEFDCRLQRTFVAFLASSDRAACTLKHALVLNVSCISLFLVASTCLIARCVHMHTHFAARRFRNATELRFLRTPLGSLIRALAYSRYSHSVHQVRAIHANLANGFSRCDLHFIGLLLDAPANRVALQQDLAAPSSTSMRLALRGASEPSRGGVTCLSGGERLSFGEAIQTVQNYVDRFMLLYDHRVGVQFGRNAFGFLKTEEISDRLEFSQVSLRFEFQDFYA